MRAIHRATVLLLILLGLAIPAEGGAGQQGGHIYYEDRAAASQRLEFRAFVWRVSDGYYRASADYREKGEDGWRDLDSNWCWTRRCALEEMVAQARYLARDGYIWRFEEPRTPARRADRYRFVERDYRDGPGPCARRLLGGSR